MGLLLRAWLEFVNESFLSFLSLAFSLSLSLSTTYTLGYMCVCVCTSLKKSPVRRGEVIAPLADRSERGFGGRKTGRGPFPPTGRS